MQATDEDWMLRALELADRAEREDDEVPVGALIIDASGELVAEGTPEVVARVAESRTAPFLRDVLAASAG